MLSARRLDDVDVELTTVATQVAAIATALSDLDSTVSTLATDVTALSTKVDALDTKVTGLEGDVLALPVDIAAEGVGSQLLTMSLEVILFGNNKKFPKNHYAAFLPGNFSNGYHAGRHPLDPYGGPQRKNADFGIPFPAGTISAFSFMLFGDQSDKKTCDVTLTIRDDGVATLLSGTITDYDGGIASKDVYADPDVIEIAAGSIINMGIAYSEGCGVSGASNQFEDTPDRIFISLHFTPAAVVATVD